jgi:hypothetical protein
MFRFSSLLRAFSKKKNIVSPVTPPKPILNSNFSTPQKNSSSDTSFAINNPVPATPLKINTLDGIDVNLSPRGDENLNIGAIEGEIIILGDKPSGIEPGYLMVPVSNVLIAMINKIRTNKPPLIDSESLRDFCETNADEAKIVFAEIKRQLMAGEGDGDASLWLVKLVYDNSAILVSPSMNRLAEAQTIKEKHWSYRWAWLLGYAAYKKFTGNRSQVNRNALLECIATGLARDYGIKAQEQVVMISAYNDGYPKIMLASKWEPKLKDFDHCLAGDKGHEKYLVQIKDKGKDKLKDKKFEDKKPVFLKDSLGYFHSDNSINNLGQIWPIKVVQNDPDSPGSHGQNQGRVDDELFVFDTGQALRTANQLVHHLHDDCSIDPPYNTFIKNLSMFSDTKLSERMAGVLCVYQISDHQTREDIFNLEEQEKIACVIDEYIHNFPSLAHINPGAEEIRFDKYITYFQALSVNKEKEVEFIVAGEYKKYADELTKAKSDSIAARTEILQRFKERLLLTPEKVDLVDHLEKLCGNTSILSKDGTVILNHLRLLPDAKPSLWQRLRGIQPEKNRIRWSIEEVGEKYFLSAVISEPQQKLIKIKLDRYLKHCESTNNISIQYSITNTGEINIRLCCTDDLDKNTQLKLLTTLFDEDNIKHFKHILAPKKHPAVATPTTLKKYNPQEAKVEEPQVVAEKSKALSLVASQRNTSATTKISPSIAMKPVLTREPEIYINQYFMNCLKRSYPDYSPTISQFEKWLGIREKSLPKSPSTETSTSTLPTYSTPSSIYETPAPSKEKSEKRSKSENNNTVRKVLEFN